ncbi:MAG: tetraacyldisaccharide 4'-kinase [Magnetococcus sp. YQC-9]
MHRLLPWLRGERQPESWALRGLLLFLGALGEVLAHYQQWRVGRYQSGTLQPYRASCPVISVGNLTVGGTGKTPMTLWIARYLQNQGYRVAVISRGYRQHSTARVTLVADHDRVHLSTPEAADEALLLARALPGVAVLTGPDRPVLIRHAIERLGSDRIILDDGFHRLDVARDLDLVLLDARRPFGNGQLLPGGILRESPQALARCHALILTRAEDPDATRATRALLQSRFPDKPILMATHHPTAWMLCSSGGDQPLPLDGLTGPVLAFCGLAVPEGFRRTLEALPLRVVDFYPFVDHHAFTSDELNQLIERAHRSGAKALVCTEKDAVKLDGWSPALPVYALRVEMRFLEGGAWLRERLNALNRTRF